MITSQSQKRSVQINYTTFARDLEWLGYSLKSVLKYAHGFEGVTIVVPTWDYEKFKHFESWGRSDLPIKVRVFMEYPGRGFLHHLAMKCSADIVDPWATHILHLDPDCLFNQPVTPDDYFAFDRPVLYFEEYADIKRASEEGVYNKDWSVRYQWKAVTERAVGFECPVETMCRHPAIHPRETYALTRAHIEAAHQTTFLDFVLRQKLSFPQGFGEFNTLGAIAFKMRHDEYHWVRVGPYVSKPPFPEKLTQLRSHDGAGHYMKEIQNALK